MFEEYVENVVRIINENGIVARAIKDIKSDGSVDYILRLTEDPNGLKWASLKFDAPEKVTKECLEAESYAKGVIEQILKMDSPVRNARTSLSKKKYDKIKGQIAPFIMDKSKYKDYLKNVPNRDFLDYSVVYCYKDELGVTYMWLNHHGWWDEYAFSEMLCVDSGSVQCLYMDRNGLHEVDDLDDLLGMLP